MGCFLAKEVTRGNQQFDELPPPLSPPCYHTVDQVAEALAKAGLVSSNLIVGIDFTKSNEWTGKYSFHGLNLHHTDRDFQNPYEHSISIIAQTLSRFNDNLIPCYGFGDESTQDEDVFSFYPDDRPCNDLYELICRYRELTPYVKLAGPTSFAPIIEMAMTIVENSGGQYHVLLIIADGQVTRSADTDANLLSPQEQRTFDALVEAGEFPLSILLVGVGDGPWDMMKKFDDPFPHFQFVNFTEIMSGNMPPSEKEATFASRALSGIPSQCVTINGRGILGRQTRRNPNKFALPPPHWISCPPSVTSSEPYTDISGASSSRSFHAQAQQYVCPICWVNPKDMAFGCGHQTCVDCSTSLEVCPICRRPIQIRLKLFN